MLVEMLYVIGVAVFLGFCFINDKGD